jgi:hypothetical protein
VSCCRVQKARSSFEAGLFSLEDGLAVTCFHEHLLRYVGWYSNRTRGERGKALKAQQAAKTPTAAIEPVSKFAAKCRGRKR